MINPLAGTGLKLQSLGVIDGLTNPEVPTPTLDIVGLIVGGALGLYVSKKHPKWVIKGLAAVVGAELGIMLVRFIGSKTVVAKNPRIGVDSETSFFS